MDDLMDGVTAAGTRCVDGVDLLPRHEAIPVGVEFGEELGDMT